MPPIARCSAYRTAVSYTHLDVYKRQPLTRLFNRRFLEESLERELQLAARRKQSVAVLFLDLDHFKGFNDTFGHDAGDMVLKSLADLFRNFFRATDICCRYGGEEFAIVLPESSSQEMCIRDSSSSFPWETA